jgi:2-polyprenyl-6-methoxyphenol hydroxylase-like FAD-dependent oxidoreductase
VRRHLCPNEGEPRSGGQVLWRGAVDCEPFLGGRTMIIAGHFRRRIIACPIAHGAVHGQLLTNWICQTAVPDTTPPRESWNRRVSNERVLAAFDTWGFAWLDMPALIRRTRNIHEFPLVDRDPVPTWTFGRVTLLGDAAHPMQPIGAQAGSQVIIGARTLTAALLATTNPIDALKRYDSERRPVMNDITLRNRCFGPAAAMQVVEDRVPHGFSRIDDVISRDNLQAIVSSFSAAAGLDTEFVNGRPAFASDDRFGST